MEGTSIATKADTSNRDVVVFHVWQSLGYNRRLAISLVLVAAGLSIQAVAVYAGFHTAIAFMAGAPLLLVGNLFLLVKGYDNRVDLNRFDPAATWETVKREKLTELKELDKKIIKWDQSAMDVTSLLGAVILLFILGAVAAATWLIPGPLKLLFLDAAVLAAPHWFTGTRRILRLPKLLVKVEAMEGVLDLAGPLIAGHDLEILMLLKGKERRIPDDVKFRLSFKGQDPDFLGLYGQVVTNDVQGRSYPYFYAVMVARKGYGLKRIFERYTPPPNVVKEYDTQDEVEFIVVRQHTTRTSGYHTKPESAIIILKEGYDLASAASGKKS